MTATVSADTLLSASEVRAFLDSRRMLSNEALEIETALHSTAQINRGLRDYFERNGFSVYDGKAQSLYFEVVLPGEEGILTLSLLENGITLRIRPGGESKKGNQKIIYQDEFAVKRINVEFNETAKEIAKRVYSDDDMRKFDPVVREEIQGAHLHPLPATELSLGQMPSLVWPGHTQSIAEILEALVVEGRIPGIEDPNDLILKPIVLTTVKRSLVKIYINPEDGSFAPEPTDEMRASGEWLAVEVSLDKCTSKQPRPNKTISHILDKEGGNKCASVDLGTRSIIEYEMESSKHHGPAITDEEAVAAWMKFGGQLSNIVSTIRPGSQLRPVRSKAVFAIGQLKACRSEKGRWYKVYNHALAHAP